ncbi:MAG TPA: hypothetical protein DEQ93_02155 [Odoribacter splanchnicus]|nr:hypothetical protein [Odoribacter splanchnicus]HCG22311.1 hypothetical protein [Odoribacter splanchnicus]
MKEHLYQQKINNKAMKSIQIYILCGLVLFSCFSCKEEDDIVPNPPMTNLFAPADGANDPTSELRRQFYTETGCYLLFTDTLKHEYTGVDAYGNALYNTELLDLTYGITSTVRWAFAFTNLPDYEEQKNAVELLKTYVLPALNKRYYPYSFLLIDNLRASAWYVEEGATDAEGFWGEFSEQSYYIGTRAIAISISKLQQNPEEFLQLLQQNIINNYLSYDKLVEFYEPGKDWYGFHDYTTAFYSEEAFIEATGILAYYYEDPWDEGEEPWLEAYDRNSDLDRYIDWILNHTEEDFENQYGDYAIVMKKYDIVKQLLIDGGFLK